MPFQCVAACIEDASGRWFSQGDLTDPVVASCSVPGLFPPVRIGDRHFLDGGLVHSIPVGRALALGATRIFVLQVGRVEQPLKPPTKPWEVATVAFEIAGGTGSSTRWSRCPTTSRCTCCPAGRRRARTSRSARPAPGGCASGWPQAEAAAGAYLRALDA